MEEEAVYPRFAHCGRTYVYVLPCRDEDMLKIGFSHDPLDRFRTLHRRFFRFFDLDRGLLIQTDRLRDARRIERLFLEAFAEYRAPAPLAVREAAAGHTEWLRGASAAAEALARETCARQGFVLHAPLGAWLRDQFAERAALLYGWSERLFDALEYEYFNVPAAARSGHAGRALRETLDACEALGMDLKSLVPPQVLAWYRSSDYFGTR
ncbi:hypothetical protein ASG87_06450 [Frateuria sp. Soil773]|uniref:GIY-YIG nuclease family protein n=1 Tax=Frateuria sp. Soil773 TaxID=1736407 RepID=UPI0006FE4806|nr:GIY-YIG nuclease family protein [Frateuria sp. Soil773]KRE89166.1 hypothetical protein ASG87_06450 [Frateuria sp. Soil773]